MIQENNPLLRYTFGFIPNVMKTIIYTDDRSFSSLILVDRLGCILITYEQV